MIDSWFKYDLTNIYGQHTVAVFIDESGDAQFLLKTIEGEYTIHQANSELEELHVKYLVEKAQPSNECYLIYTHTKKDNLKFIREYCETCGCIEITYLENYIKTNIHQALNLNINLSKEELISAAKVSVGKDKNYWWNLCHKGSAEIFDLDKELLPFLHDPEKYSNVNYDEQLMNTFYMEVNELLEQEYMSKPASTLAGEVVNAMLDGLANGNCKKTLETVYESWLDSISYRDSFNKYIKNYELNPDLDIWNISSKHPFRQVDDKWLCEIGNNISNKEYVSNIITKLRKRNNSTQAKALGIFFWKDVIDLLSFDPKNIAYLSSFTECVDYYKTYFYKLDTAIRNLYAEFLNRKEIIEPFQELYKEYVSIFLDKWFSYFKDYKETQTGALQHIIDNTGGKKTAVIVGDGISYEIAELVAAKVKTTASLKKDTILADIPSETENNMSRIYMANGITEAIQSNREKYLVSQNPNIIDFIQLDEVTEDARTGQILICTYKDIDDMGETLQQKALKYFPETIDFFAEKISLLLASGYAKVYLITDHGFVLTGLLSEADKISVSPKGDFDKAERYIRTVQKQTDLVPRLIEEERSYKHFKYLYFAKIMNPFKTPGLYGYSHGGISPQELITPYFCWEQFGVKELSVSISNKQDLSNITGELFTIKIQAHQGNGDMFSIDRKLYLVFFSNKKQVNTSDIFTIQCNEVINKEYPFEGNTELEVLLLDASTKQQLDKVVVKKNKDRDLCGLL